MGIAQVRRTYLGLLNSAHIKEKDFWCWQKFYERLLLRHQLLLSEMLYRLYVCQFIHTLDGNIFLVQRHVIERSLLSGITKLSA